MSKEFPDLTGDGKVTQADILKGRKVFAEGGSMTLLMPFEGIKPDVEMENDYVSYVMDETL